MAKTTSVLIVEDDVDLSDVIASFLRLHGYACTQAYSGTEASLRCFELTGGRPPFDIVVSDLMLPGLSGEEFITLFRAKSNAPIVVTSAKGALVDKVGLLRMGADDYLVKPFELEELLARIEACLRRTATSSTSCGADNGLSFGRWALVPASREFLVDGTPVKLTRTEFEILELLTRHPGRVFTRSEIANTAHNDGADRGDKTADAHIANIRAKLRPTGTDTYIDTVWGIARRGLHPQGEAFIPNREIADQYKACVTREGQLGRGRPQHRHRGQRRLVRHRLRPQGQAARLLD